MNKLAFALIFSTIVVIKGISVNNYNTEPYHSFDWLDNDENKFKIEYTLASGESISNYFCFLYNQSVACKTSCTVSSSTIEITVKGNDCKADGDNPTYKYYYSTYCMAFPTTPTFIDPDDNTGTKQITLTKDSDSATILKYIRAVPTAVDTSNDVQVTIAVSNGSFLKYSMILLSLLIL